jgi:hypothetical protein
LEAMRRVGTSETGTVVHEQAVQLRSPEGTWWTLRRITVTLKSKTRNGDTALVILTNLPIAVADAMTIAACYRSRWGIDIDQPYCLHKAVIRTWKGMLAHRYVGGWPSRVVPCGVRAGVRIPARRPTPASGCARPGGPGGRAPSPYESN